LVGEPLLVQKGRVNVERLPGQLRKGFFEPFGNLDRERQHAVLTVDHEKSMIVDRGICPCLGAYEKQRQGSAHHRRKHGVGASLRSVLAM